MKRGLLAALISFILSIFAIAIMGKLGVISIAIDGNASLLIAVASLIAVMVTSYLHSKK